MGHTPKIRCAECDRIAPLYDSAYYGHVLHHFCSQFCLKIWTKKYKPTMPQGKF